MGQVRTGTPGLPGTGRFRANSGVAETDLDLLRGGFQISAPCPPQLLNHDLDAAPLPGLSRQVPAPQPAA